MSSAPWSWERGNAGAAPGAEACAPAGAHRPPHSAASFPPPPSAAPPRSPRALLRHPASWPRTAGDAAPAPAPLGLISRTGRRMGGA